MQSARAEHEQLELFLFLTYKMNVKKFENCWEFEIFK